MDGELAALERDGYVFAAPIVLRAFSAYRLVRAVGFENALRLGEGEWRGWEVHFLGAALAAITEFEERAQVLDSFAALRAFGARPRG